VPSRTGTASIVAVSLRMTFPRLWAFLAIALPVLGSLIANLSTVDLAYHLRAGGEILDTRVIPTVDSWTFTAPGSPWLDQQWLGQVLLGGVHRLGGWTGLAIVRAVLVGVIFTCLFLASRLRGLDLRRSAWLTIGAFIVVAAALALRPQLLGMTLFSLAVLLVADRERHPGRLWAIPVITILWANIHGSFFLGPVLLGLACLEDVERRAAGSRRLLAIAAVSAAAALVNPFGLEVWRYAIGLSTNGFVSSRITEWQPTSLRSGPGILFFGSVALVVMLIARRGRPVPWSTLVWIGVFAAIGTYAIRGVAWWSLGSILAVASLLVPAKPVEGEVAVPAKRERASVLNGIVAASVALACLALVPLWRPVDTRLGAPSGVLGDAPPGLTTALRSTARPDERVLNPQSWGSWFEFAVPSASYAVDSRIELFTAATWSAYERARNGAEDWNAILADWGVTLVVTDFTEDDLTARLQAASWAVVYQDSDGTLFSAPTRR
jgi:hypothetical protein